MISMRPGPSSVLVPVDAEVEIHHVLVGGRLPRPASRTVASSPQQGQFPAFQGKSGPPSVRVVSLKTGSMSWMAQVGGDRNAFEARFVAGDDQVAGDVEVGATGQGSRGLRRG